MKAYAKEIILTLIILSAAGYLALNWSKLSTSESHPDSAVAPCKSEPFTMRDEWLPGRLENNQAVTITTNWRECGRELERGAIVLYKISPAHEPVAKVLAAVPGDDFQLQKTQENNSWNIKINGEVHLDQSQNPYRFGSASPPALKLYEQAHKGILDSSSVLLFSTKSPGDQDSGTLGVLNSTDIIGLVDLPKQ